MNNADYTIERARYAKNSVAVRVHDNSDGMKGRCARLCDALKARYSNRERAYIMSVSKGEKFKALHASGRDASLKFNSIYDAEYVLDPGPGDGAL